MFFMSLSIVLDNFRLMQIEQFEELLLCSNTLYTSSSIMAPTVALENMNPCIKKMEYAVRGPLVIRATAVEKVQQHDNKNIITIFLSKIDSPAFRSCKMESRNLCNQG